MLRIDDAYESWWYTRRCDRRQCACWEHDHSEMLASATVSDVQWRLTKQLRPLLVGCVVALIGTVVSAPWWLVVARRHGFRTLLNAAGSRGTFLGNLYGVVLFNPFQESFWEQLVVLGAFYAIVRHSYGTFLTLWFVGLMAVGEVGYLRPISGAVLVAIGLIGVVVPCLYDAATQSVASFSTPTRAVIPPLFAFGFIVLVVMHSVGTAGVAAYGEGFDGPQQDTLDALAWVEGQTPPDSQFVIVDPDPEAGWWIGDWFPAMTDRTAIDVRYGQEWKGRFDERRELDLSVNDATTVEELHQAIRESSVEPPTHVFIHRSKRTSSLVANLRQSSHATQVFANEGVVIFNVGQFTLQEDSENRPLTPQNMFANWFRVEIPIAKSTGDWILRRLG